MKIDTLDEIQKELYKLFKKLFMVDDRIQPDALQIKKKLDKILPVTIQDMSNLKEDILENGVLSPLIMWDRVLIDGWKRYKIAKKHKIKFKYINKKFESIQDAEIWLFLQKIRQGKMNDWQKFKVYMLANGEEIEPKKEKPKIFLDTVFGLERKQ